MALGEAEGQTGILGPAWTAPGLCSPEPDRAPTHTPQATERCPFPGCTGVGTAAPHSLSQVCWAQVWARPGVVPVHSLPLPSCKISSASKEGIRVACRSSQCGGGRSCPQVTKSQGPGAGSPPAWPRLCPCRSSLPVFWPTPRYQCRVYSRKPITEHEGAMIMPTRSTRAAGFLLAGQGMRLTPHLLSGFPAHGASVLLNQHKLDLLTHR